METDTQKIRITLKEKGNARTAENYKKYLKSPYEFYGIRAPELRKIAKNFKKMQIYDTFNLFDELWNSGNHEEMSLALYTLQQMKKSFNLEMWRFLTAENRLGKLKTWDHVDNLGAGILGFILINNAQLQAEIKNMSNSTNSWIRRLSIVSQLPMIKKNKIQLTLRLAEKLAYDEDTYVQKGAGWMLREAGKKNALEVEEFIILHKNMKSAAFSYAVEKMPSLKKRIKDFKKSVKSS